MNNLGVIDVISGDKPVKVEVGIDYLSAAILAAAIFLAGFFIVIINKKM